MVLPYLLLLCVKSFSPIVKTLVSYINGRELTSQRSGVVDVIILAIRVTSLAFWSKSFFILSLLPLEIALEGFLNVRVFL